MIKYSIKSQNLNNSLVFYRALFDKMPDHLGIDFMHFDTTNFRLVIEEGISQSQTLTLEVENSELPNIYQRMNRFLSKVRLKENCEIIREAIGLIDPDGNHWHIGNPTVEIQFEKCYVTN